MTSAEHDPTSTIIVGAGIGGLTATLALHHRGIPVTVLERAAEIRPLGVGINLQPAAVGQLGELGLSRSLASMSVAARDMSVTSPARSSRPGSRCGAGSPRSQSSSTAGPW